MLGFLWYQVSVGGTWGPWLLLLRYGYAAGQLILFLMTNRFTVVQDPGSFEALPTQSELLFAGGMRFLQRWPWLQRGVVLAAGVPLVAGEITAEKQRGTLALLLTTQLGPAGIVGIVSQLTGESWMNGQVLGSLVTCWMLEYWRRLFLKAAVKEITLRDRLRQRELTLRGRI
jgi:hypothetical protein